MVKSFAIIRRKPGLTLEEFLHYWKEKHGPLAAKEIPGLKKYVQNHPIKVPGSDIRIEIDGIAELWWENLEAFQNYLAWRKTEKANVLKEDERKFFDADTWQRFFAEEYVVVAG